MPDRLASLDLLRGLAILMVVLFHCTIFFGPNSSLLGVAKYGAHGVQLFFIVSAFTMCTMWVARENEPFRTTKFLIRRFMRIAPLFWLAAVLWAGYKAGSLHQPPTGLQFLTTVAFLDGVLPWASGDVVPGGWSIAIEMFFYALLPLIVACSRQSTSRALALFVVLMLVFNVGLASPLAHLAAGGSGDAQLQERMYRSVYTQLPVFVLGVLVFQIVRFGADWRWPLGFLAAFFAVTLVLKHFFMLNSRPFFWAICFLLALAAVLVMRLGWENRLLQAIGGMSYSLYLIHFAVLELFLVAAPAALRGGWTSYALWTAATLLLSTGLAWLSKSTLEKWSTDAARSIIARLPAR